MINVYAFKWAPPFAQGLVRDLRVRWALEEAGLAYQEKLIGFEDASSEDYRALQPFSQVPAYEEDGLVLFETGAIVLHIARRSDVLMPADPRHEAQVTTWMFAALNTVEQPIQTFGLMDLFNKGPAWDALRPTVIEMIEKRLDALAQELKDNDYLVGRFSAADLLMTTVLRILRNTDLVERRPVLDAYKKRNEDRPAFQKALADQIAAFERHAPVAA
ncbi:MAG TPA: glutathione S-transferase family protein [Allosphingosinicella sp.]|nr:glutathione S-transferase family protein [Allosphingosinicella sp.]